MALDNVTIGPWRQNINVAGGGGYGEGGSHLQPPGGGGTYDGMEARVAVLETHIEHLKDDMTEIRKDVRELRADLRLDFRILFGALITVALGLAGLMAKGFHWLG
jgi:hypothetical protein